MVNIICAKHRPVQIVTVSIFQAQTLHHVVLTLFYVINYLLGFCFFVFGGFFEQLYGSEATG